MPRGIYSRLKCVNTEKEPFTPLPHQIETAEYFLKSPYKGLLLYHKLGSGKTCTAIMIADKMLKEKKVDKVMVLTPGSLRQGWVNEYCKICGEDPSNLEKYFTFITYNYAVGKSLPDFNNSLVIVDEIHNLINGVKNDSKNPSLIYAKILLSKCRVLALSGTPVFNYVWEFPILGRLLKPGDDFSNHDGTSVSSDVWMTYFSEDSEGHISPRNPSSMKDRLKGIISYYPGAEEFMPKVIEEEPIQVPMSLEQEKNYWDRLGSEEELRHHPPSERLKYSDPVKYKLLTELYIMAKKRIMSREASNFFYSPQIRAITQKMVPTEIGERAITVVSDRLEKDGGWVERKWFEGGLLKTYSKKFIAIFLNIAFRPNQKHFVFSFFKEKAGVVLLHSMFKMCGIRSAIFTGDLDDASRKSLLARFNAPGNRQGEKIQVLLATEAGAEGISVREVRHMHILESSPKMSKTIQSIGRVARFRSHMDLPPDQRTVRIWRYWSVRGNANITAKFIKYDEKGNMIVVEKEVTKAVCVDEELYLDGKKTLNRVNSFLELLKSVSVTKV